MFRRIFKASRVKCNFRRCFAVPSWQARHCQSCPRGSYQWRPGQVKTQQAKWDKRITWFGACWTYLVRHKSTFWGNFLYWYHLPQPIEASGSCLLHRTCMETWPAISDHELLWPPSGSETVGISRNIHSSMMMASTGKEWHPICGAYIRSS